MTEKAGETARETGEYRCEKCLHLIRLRDGDPIPRCPRCSNETFDLRNRRFDSPEAATEHHDSLKEE